MIIVGFGDKKTKLKQDLTIYTFYTIQKRRSMMPENWKSIAITIYKLCNMSDYKETDVLLECMHHFITFINLWMFEGKQYELLQATSCRAHSKHLYNSTGVTRETIYRS